MTDQPPPTPVLPPPDPGPRRTPRRSHRRSRRKALIAVLIAMLALGSIGTVSVVGISRIYHHFTEGTEDFEGPGGEEVRFQISLGNSVRTIGRHLEEAGVVRTEGSFVAAARDEPKATALQPGWYRLKKEMRAVDALALLLDPDSKILARAVVQEGRTAAEVLTILSKESTLPIEKFQDELKNMLALGFPGWAHNNPEGFLFPATYDIDPDATAESILRDVAKRFKQALADTELVSRAALVGQTPIGVLTIASLIEEEAKLPEDFGKVARVIYNRLEKGMPLQLDSTVRYVTGKRAITTSDADRANDSPYNTYKVKGLPPGPISSPGRPAIEAALSPTPGEWLYFVAVNPDTGETKFAVTGAEHLRNVEEFRRWAREHPDD